MLPSTCARDPNSARRRPVFDKFLEHCPLEGRSKARTNGCRSCSAGARELGDLVLEEGREDLDDLFHQVAEGPRALDVDLFDVDLGVARVDVERLRVASLVFR